mmetsp:Transcript_25958/g.21857  ORF Transcript_25958/g.21857 Transcript_25958/m.21857 type:complete len:130 (+) Transcript_25958:446-835(+)
MSATTSLSILVKSFPDILDKLKRIVVVGGCVQRGNFNQLAEFNVFSDPESTSIVFKSGLDVCIVPFDSAENMYLSQPNSQMFHKLFKKHPRSNIILSLLVEHSSQFINPHLNTNTTNNFYNIIGIMFMI